MIAQGFLAAGAGLLKFLAGREPGRDGGHDARTSLRGLGMYQELYSDIRSDGTNIGLTQNGISIIDAEYNLKLRYKPYLYMYRATTSSLCVKQMRDRQKGSPLVKFHSALERAKSDFVEGPIADRKSVV